MKKVGRKSKNAVPNYRLDSGVKVGGVKNIAMTTLVEQAQAKDNRKVRNKQTGNNK